MKYPDGDEAILIVSGVRTEMLSPLAKDCVSAFKVALRGCARIVGGSLLKERAAPLESIRGPST